MLPNSDVAIELAAVVYADGRAELLAVASDSCAIYSSRSIDRINRGPGSGGGRAAIT